MRKILQTIKSLNPTIKALFSVPALLYLAMGLSSYFPDKSIPAIRTAQASALDISILAVSAASPALLATHTYSADILIQIISKQPTIYSCSSADTLYKPIPSHTNSSVIPKRALLAAPLCPLFWGPIRYIYLQTGMCT